LFDEQGEKRDKFSLKPADAKVCSDFFITFIKVPGQLTPNHLTPESTHPIFGQLTLYMK